METQTGKVRNIKVALPQHIVLFPDGNRRWAREQGLDTLEGHRVGYQKLKELCTWCTSRGVKALTAYGFSTENWNRTPREVQYLMTLLEKGIQENFLSEEGKRDIEEQGIRVRVIGQKERLPQSLQEVIKEVEEYTKDKKGFFLNLAISYGGRWDIVQAVKKIMALGINPDTLDEQMFSLHLSTNGMPEPDLVIRAGGEQRFSNFLLWQSAYAELYFSPKYWPAFTEEDFEDALEEYARRSRRFGS
ncbi:MAG: di-trans,poly-cis-decaprenylcistransferase [Candidatus Wildermuthbacteria bacterium]|nr:di-trans,poly-cis-decaprenylcistransferase [Candidatus Wildermuthbacteria bacterium]